MKLLSIASGSSGNCIYVGDKKTNLLIDAGISGKRIESGLEENNISIEKIKGILVTHEHLDHVSSLGILLDVIIFLFIQLRKPSKNSVK